MSYTVQQLATLSGVTVRTLHHYDQIGLLKPSRIRNNGYREYNEPELLRLQQILFFRELDFPLDEIKSMLNRKSFDMVEALKEHKTLIRLKQKHLENLVKTIDRTIKRITMDEKKNDEELYDAFKDPDVKGYQDEVRERWGDTEAYAQSMARVKKMTKKEMDELKAKGKEFNQKLAVAMASGVGVDSPEMQAMVAEHYKGIQFFYDCPIEMYRNLGEMYVQDPRFTKTYDTVRPGLAVYLRDAIRVFCDTKAAQ